jgi:Holliday junction resolvase RusA-like endonuclease
MNTPELPITMTWPGEPRSKKNSVRVVRNGPRPVLLPSGAFTAYQEAVGWHIHQYKRIMLDAPVNIRCVYYMAAHRRVDLLNLLAATCDILVRYGVIRDDCADIVTSHDGSRVLYDKQNPRAVITITAEPPNPLQDNSISNEKNIQDKQN